MDESALNPAMMALVVATAGIMFPAICLISNLVLSGIWNTCDRKLAAETTKSSVSSSSLSKSTGPVFRRWAILCVESTKTATFSAAVQSLCPSNVCALVSSNSNGVGFSLVVHRVSIRSNRSMSSLKILAMILYT
ncbi:hypothetical protein OGAPHI_007252 [Ogataea philodendri]|uniref:Uncharacterized protein n=1 Tax=Ogataea philodendri TaxID=1378263 RepID=A0A9P8NUT8_9ASCO|nr:uncharacterized protein OGAPHI_007252 [Ogataea philodendri]KAH3660047.1 hypothetical protein OGAPHI_007252 [Ogataea philodendri]